MPVFLATQEAEIRRILAGIQPGQKPYLEKTIIRKGLAK
jgi:hypothetical protein